jgi:hypothetical protein
MLIFIFIMMKTSAKQATDAAIIRKIIVITTALITGGIDIEGFHQDLINVSFANN